MTNDDKKNKKSIIMKTIAIVLVIAIVVIFVALVVNEDISVYTDESYINITPDGAIQLNTTGFKVVEYAVVEDSYTGQFDNRRFYEITDIYGNSANLTMYYSAINSTNSSEVVLSDSDYAPISYWAGNYSGKTYSLSVEESNNYRVFSPQFLEERIVVNSSLLNKNNQSETKNASVDYINVTPDGAIKLNTTGYEVAHFVIVEETYTGQSYNYSEYELKDTYGNFANITIYNKTSESSQSTDTNNSTANLSSNLNKSYDWVKDYNGFTYSINIDNTNNDGLFNSDFLKARIIEN